MVHVFCQIRFGGSGCAAQQSKQDRIAVTGEKKTESQKERERERERKKEQERARGRVERSKRAIAKKTNKSPKPISYRITLIIITETVLRRAAGHAAHSWRPPQILGSQSYAHELGFSKTSEIGESSKITAPSSSHTGSVFPRP